MKIAINQKCQFWHLNGYQTNNPSKKTINKEVLRVFNCLTFKRTSSINVEPSLEKRLLKWQGIVSKLLKILPSLVQIVSSVYLGRSVRNIKSLISIFDRVKAIFCWAKGKGVRGVTSGCNNIQNWRSILMTIHELNLILLPRPIVVKQITYSSKISMVLHRLEPFITRDGNLLPISNLPSKMRFDPIKGSKHSFPSKQISYILY